MKKIGKIVRGLRFKIFAKSNIELTKNLKLRSKIYIFFKKKKLTKVVKYYFVLFFQFI